MKKQLNKLFLFALAGSLLFLSSCGGSQPDIEDAAGLKKLKEKFEKEFGADTKVNELTLNAKDHMSSKFSMGTIDYVENGKLMTRSYNNYPKETVSNAEPSRIQNELMLKNKQGSVAIKDLNFDQIPAKVKEAIAMIPQEYEDFHLYRWSFEVDNNNKVGADFTIEGAKKGEDSKRQGRMIVSNYYEFPFTMDENGKLTLNE